MNRGLWIFQFDQWPSQDIPGDCAALGINRVLVKALDGGDWMAAFDHSSDSISGVPSLLDWEQAFAKRGIIMDAWVNPTPDTWYAATMIYESILSAIRGRLILDLEPYEHFWWPSDSPIDRIYNWVNGRNRVGVCFDPNRMDFYQPPSAPLLKVAQYLLPMVYDRGRRNALLAFESPPRWAPWEPVISTDDPEGEGGWAGVVFNDLLGSQEGCTGFSVWRAPVTQPDQLTFLRSINNLIPRPQ